MAALLLVRLWSDPDPEERARIYDWIAADPAHGVAFARAERVWEQAARIAPSSAAAMPDNWMLSWRHNGIGSFMLGGVAAASLLIASPATPLQAGTSSAPPRCSGVAAP